MADKKRERNFTESEVDILLKLVKIHAKIIENKKTDQTSNKSKDEEWQKLASEFNSMSGIHYRDVKALKAKYENCKKVLKRKYGDYKVNIHKTGGGSLPDLQLTQNEEMIMTMVGPSVEGLPARYDGDTIQVSTSNDEQHQQDSQALQLPAFIYDKDSTAQPRIFNEQFTSELPSSQRQSIATQVLSDGVNQPQISHPQNVGMSIPSTSQLTNNSTPVSSDRFILKRRMTSALKPPRHKKAVFDDTMVEYGIVAKKKKELLDAQINFINIQSRQLQITAERDQLKEEREKKEHNLRCELLLLEIELKKKSLK